MTDLHIHTTFSDGTVPIEEVVRLYGESGFDAIAITDHLFDTQSPRSLELYEEGKSVRDLDPYFRTIGDLARWAKEKYDLLVIPGLEICNLQEDYHILGIDLKEAIDPNQEAEAVIEAIHRQNGLAIASHPPLKLSYFLRGDKESIRRHPLHLWKHRKRYAGKIDAWEIGNREDLFGSVGLERFPHIANSDFHDRNHFTSWKSLVFAGKETEAIKKAIVERRVSLFFFREGREDPPRPTAETLEEPVQPSKIHAGLQEGVGKARILIADDERDLVKMLSYNLGKKGYQVLTAHDGFEAWKKIESERPDLLILDLMMPELDGWELCRLIRQSQRDDIKNLGILMLTARALPEDRVYGLELGADDYLTKPFSISELIVRAEKILQKRRVVSGLQDAMDGLRLDAKSKDETLHKIVHDLKTPLISMGASAKLLLNHHPDDPKVKFLQNIYDNTVHLTRWIEDILKLHRPAVKDEKNGMGIVDIQALVKQGVESLKGYAMEKDMEVLYQAGPSVPAIQGQEQALRRAIENLIFNAIKYTPRGGRVEVSVIPYLMRKGGGVVEISIRDTGMGIIPEDQERIFEPFYRGKNASSEPGMGLGLSLAKEVVDLHGGKILVQSEPNKGSTFSILLPVSSYIPVETITEKGIRKIDQNMERT